MQKNKLNQPIASSLYRPRSKKFSFSKFFKNTALFTLFFSFFLAIAVFPSQIVKAEGPEWRSTSNLYKKLMLRNALRCQQYYFKKSFTPFSNDRVSTDEQLKRLFSYESGDNPVRMFAGQGDVKDYNLKCSQFFLGGQDFKFIFNGLNWKLGTGFIEMTGNKKPANHQDLTDLMTKLGYRNLQKTDNLLSIPFLYKGSFIQRTRNIELNIKNGKIEDLSIIDKGDDAGETRQGYKFLSKESGKICIGTKRHFSSDPNSQKCLDYKNRTIKDFKEDLALAFNSVLSSEEFKNLTNGSIGRLNNKEITSSDISVDKARLEYFLDSNSEFSKIKLIRDFAGIDDLNLGLTKEEKLAMYHSAIAQGFFRGKEPKSYISCKNRADFKTTIDGYKEIKVGVNQNNFTDYDKSKICLVNLGQKNSDISNVFFPQELKNSEIIFPKKGEEDQSKTLAETINLLNSLVDELKKDPNFKLDKALEESAGFSGSSKTDTEQNAEGVSDPCYQNGGPSGWMLCPVINGIRDAFENIFKDFFINTMNVSSTIFDQDDEDKGVYGAWKQFRDYANIFFIIVLLVIVISQLTGLGIDNYGIKRLLPKIITVAILTNLSYIISQVLVDISNIVGKSIYDLLTNIANATPIDVVDRTKSDFIMLAIGIISLIMAAFSLGTGLILIFAVFLVGVAISAFFMLAVLSVRKALTIMLIVVSPLAFMAYLLPNTKTFFDKWKDAMKASLFLYPICSLVIGGGYLAGRILMSTAGSGDVVQHFAALILMFAPFFAVPSLAKTSLRAFGDLGNRISGIGRKASGISTGAIRKSESYQNLYDNWRSKTALRKSTRAEALEAIENRQARDKNINRFLSKEGTEARRQARLDAESKKLKEQEMVSIKKDAGFAYGEDVGAMYEEFKKSVASGNNERANAIMSLAGDKKYLAQDFSEKLMRDSDLSLDAKKTAAKAMITGDGAKNYRSGNALAYEYARQIVSGKDIYGNEFNSYDTNKWLENKDNIKSTIDKHISNGSDLEGNKGSVIRAIYDYAGNEEKERLRQMESDHRKEYLRTGQADNSKHEDMAYIAGFNSEKERREHEHNVELNQKAEQNNPYAHLSTEDIGSIIAKTRDADRSVNRELLVREYHKRKTQGGDTTINIQQNNNSKNSNNNQ